MTQVIKIVFRGVAGDPGCSPHQHSGWVSGMSLESNMSFRWQTNPANLPVSYAETAIGYGFIDFLDVSTPSRIESALDTITHIETYWTDGPDGVPDYDQRNGRHNGDDLKVSAVFVDSQSSLKELLAFYMRPPERHHVHLNRDCAPIVLVGEASDVRHWTGPAGAAWKFHAASVTIKWSSRSDSALETSAAALITLWSTMNSVNASFYAGSALLSERQAAALAYATAAASYIDAVAEATRANLGV